MKTYIGEKETKWLFVILITSRIFVDGITKFVQSSGTAAFINVAWCTLISLLYFAVLKTVQGKKSQDFFEVMNIAYSKPTEIVIGTALTAVSVLNCAVRLRKFTLAISDVILPNSPQSYVVIFFAAAITAVILFGIEPVTRYALATGICVVCFSAVICLFNISEYDVLNICPVFGNGISGIVSGSNLAYMFSDVLYIYVISGFFKKGYSISKIGYKSILLSGVVMIILTGVYTLLFAYPLQLEYKYPVFKMASVATTSVLFQRLDGIVYVIWIFIGFLSTGSLALFTLYIFSKTFGTSDYKGTAPAMILVIAVLSCAKIDYPKWLNTVLLILVSAIILVTFVISKAKGQGGKQNEI